METIHSYISGTRTLFCLVKLGEYIFFINKITLFDIYLKKHTLSYYSTTSCQALSYIHLTKLAQLRVQHKLAWIKNNNTYQGKLGISFKCEKMKQW